MFGRDGDLTHQGAFEGVGVDFGEGGSKVIEEEVDDRDGDGMQADGLGGVVDDFSEDVEVVVVMGADAVGKGVGFGVVAIGAAEEFRTDANVLEESKLGFEGVVGWQGRTKQVVEVEENVVHPRAVVGGGVAQGVFDIWGAAEGGTGTIENTTGSVGNGNNGIEPD